MGHIFLRLCLPGNLWMPDIVNLTLFDVGFFLFL